MTSLVPANIIASRFLQCFPHLGLSSDYRALSGHWGLLSAVLVVAVVGKLVGCGLAALAAGLNWVRSFRIGCGMISRGEVGLIVTAMGASTGIFNKAEVAVMVAMVLLTTLLTPLALRAAFQMRADDDEDPFTDAVGSLAVASSPEITSPELVVDEDLEELKQPERREGLNPGLEIAF